MTGLTNKQRMFVEAYLECWNATEAAKRAGYQGTYESLRVIGSQNLTKPKIRTKIEERILGEAMSANEVLARLAEQARGNVAEFITETGAIDWEAVRVRGYLVKKIRHTKGKHSTIELHDSQSALALLGKHLRLFVEQMDITTQGEKISGLAATSDTDLAAELAELDARIKAVERTEAGAATGAIEAGGTDEC